MSTAWPTEAETTHCTSTRAHVAHTWRGMECRGRTHLDTLTLPQVEAVADALGLDPGRLFLSIQAAREAQR